MKIIIIDNSDLSYSGDDINGKTLRGTEASLILLSEQFIKMGIHVDYCNCINSKKKVNGVHILSCMQEVEQAYRTNIRTPPHVPSVQ